MATINIIDGRTIHQIQSGQVIVDLCSVVKELVENSLDAGATSIDVRFKNQGLDSIEVQDNGTGIAAANYEKLALKHHTSKLSSYSDLTTLQTFGFRGEALSSLCALSHFSVVTCMAQDAPKGTKLEFGVSGKLWGTSVVAAQKGTTVTVEHLFNNLPVRRKELERNIKREWGKVVSHLNQYACIQTGIKFSVSQQVAKGKKTIIFATKGNPTTRENIVNVFGAKTLTALIAMDLKLELEPSSGPSQRWGAQDDGGKKEIRIVGHISRPANGEGRQTPDRQMFFVNSRPCGLPQVAKAFNEVYKSYNSSQSPFIFANIELDTHLYDVNVSPDKRTILLHDQNRMLENLKEALTALFESQDYTVPISQLPAQKQPSYKQLSITRDSTTPSKTPQPENPKVSRTPTSPEIEEELEHGSRASRRDQSAGSESSRRASVLSNRQTSVSQEPQSRAVSRDSLTKDRGSVSLISNWLARKTETRVEEVEQVVKPAKVSRERSEGLSKDKQKLVEKLTKEGQYEPTPGASEDLQNPSSGPYLYDLGLGEPIPRRQRSTSVLSQRAESPIPSLQSAPKPTSSIADRFSSSAKSQRPPADIATITIGDHTVTSSLGTPCPKRHKPNEVASTAPDMFVFGQSAALAKAKLPSFGSILSQKFTAPGTAAQDSQAVEYDGTDIEDPHIASDPHNRVINYAPIQSSVEHSYARIEQRPDIQTAQMKGLDEDSADRPVSPQTVEEDISDMTEEQKKVLEEAKVLQMIMDAENSATLILTQEKEARAKVMQRGGSKKDRPLNLVQRIETSVSAIENQFLKLESKLASYQAAPIAKSEDDGVESQNAEEKLSLTVSKSDFAKMKIIGQFNLGFILASRTGDKSEESKTGDDLFIIDQHASDEKYNFERLQATTIVQSQRLVVPKVLDLTAMEEEIVMENLSTLSTNGFIVTIDDSGLAPVGKRCSLIALPLSRETAFNLSDLEELISLLAEPGVLVGEGNMPRPSKVRKMFAMRACRSSVMIGKSLTGKQMGGLVRQMGELDKPWNCPHGRPTMRHLCGLGNWDEGTWREGDLMDGEEEGVGGWMKRGERMNLKGLCERKREQMERLEVIDHAAEDAEEDVEIAGLEAIGEAEGAERAERAERGSEPESESEPESSENKDAEVYDTGSATGIDGPVLEENAVADGGEGMYDRGPAYEASMDGMEDNIVPEENVEAEPEPMDEDAMNTAMYLAYAAAAREDPDLDLTLGSDSISDSESESDEDEELADAELEDAGNSMREDGEESADGEEGEEVL